MHTEWYFTFSSLKFSFNSQESATGEVKHAVKAKGLKKNSDMERKITLDLMLSQIDAKLAHTQVPSVAVNYPFNMKRDKTHNIFNVEMVSRILITKIYQCFRQRSSNSLSTRGELEMRDPLYPLVIKMTCKKKQLFTCDIF